MKQKNFVILIGVLVLLAASFTEEVFAQPSDAQIKKDLTGAKTVAVTLGKTGTKEWSSTYKKYIWTRSFTAKVKTEDPEIFVIVKGYAAYDIVGGSYRFWRSFVTSNNYEGIPDPSESDVRALIDKFGVEQFMGSGYFGRVIGRVESIKLAPEPKFQWHNPNSVSFRVVAVYMEKLNDVGGKEKVARTFEIRLYRDNPKSAWKNLNSTPREVEKL